MNEKFRESLEKVRVLQRKLYRLAKEKPSRNFSRLYDYINMDALRAGWMQVKENQAAGIDGVTIEDVEKQGVEKYLEKILESLKKKTYRPSPVRRVYIPKSGNKLRPIGIPRVLDRIVQAATKLILEPIFEAQFAEFSYGYRPRRSAQDAIEEVTKWIAYGKTEILDADIEKFFDTIDQEKLIKYIQEKVSDPRINKLIRMWLKSGVMEAGEYSPTEVGSAQGSVISPLLSNIYLNKFDQEWKRLGMDKQWKRDCHVVRYCDDMVILCPEGEAKRAMKVVEETMTNLGLKLNKEKTKIVQAEEGFEFLGYRIEQKRNPKNGKPYPYCWPSEKAEKKFRDKIKRELKQANLNIKLEEVIKLLNPIIRGWHNYFARAKNNYGNWIFHKMDFWIKSKLRWFYKRKYANASWRRFHKALEGCSVELLEMSYS